MEDYIEKLFKQYPFIYKIGDRFFAFGTGVCSECLKQDREGLKYRYKRYCDNVDVEMDRETAWKIFRKLNAIGEIIIQEEGPCYNPEEKIKEFNFNEEEMAELEAQIEQYVKNWVNHGLADWATGRYTSV